MIADARRSEAVGNRILFFLKCDKVAGGNLVLEIGALSNPDGEGLIVRAASQRDDFDENEAVWLNPRILGSMNGNGSQCLCTVHNRQPVGSYAFAFSIGAINIFNLQTFAISGQSVVQVEEMLRFFGNCFLDSVVDLS